MRNLFRWFLITAAGWLAASSLQAENSERLEEGRAIAGEFGLQLRTALQAAMNEGGPLSAIRVCNEAAPAVAQATAAHTGAIVGRTSLKLRNPANAPDAHERATLIAFAQAVDPAGQEPPSERIDVLEDGRVRYMSAIIMQPPCLACHGESLAPQVAEAIDALYPDDGARGYRVGDLRGAFTITWPAD